MRRIHVAITIGLLLVSASGLWAQNTAATGPAESVLKHIPAGAMGYVVVNNIQDTTTKIEKFMTSVGAMPPPQPNVPPVSILQELRKAAKLGDGFNPNAGAAVVLLDLKQFGINLPKLALSGITGEEPDEKDAKALAAGFPFVLYVPGSSIEGVFGNYEIVKKDQEFATVQLRMGKMFASSAGSYILLSPNKAALKAVASADKKTGDELSKAKTALITRNDIAYHVDFKLLAPTVTALIDAAGKQAASEEPDIGKILNIYFSMITKLFGQLDSEAGGIRIDKTGIVAESLDTAKTGSEIAKSWTAMGKAKSRGGAGVLDSLPSLPYVVAFGAAGESGATGNLDFLTKLIDDVLAIEPLATKLTAETKAKTRKVAADLIDQVGEVQFVGGGAPAGNGMFGLAWSIKCKDSAKLKALLADKAALAQTFITTLIDDKDAKALKITYSKDIEKAGDVSIDAIEISHPEMLKMKENERTEMTKILGEDKIRFLIAAPDKQTVVVTFAGSTAMTGKAVAAASGKGTIPKAPGTAAALEVLPKDPNMLVFLNVANLMDVIRNGMASQIEDPEQRQQMLAIVPQFQCKTPIAIGAKLENDTAHAVLYVPSDLIKEAIPAVQRVIMMFMMRGMDDGQPGGGQGPPPPPAGDF